MCGYICFRTPGCLGLAGQASMLKNVTVIFHAGVIAAIVVVVFFCCCGCSATSFCGNPIGRCHGDHRGWERNNLPLAGWD